MSESAITPDTTMEEILRAHPSAQRALFQRYHVGGCSSCGFQPTETLAEVCKDHNILDVDEVIRHLVESHEVDRRLQVDAADVRAWIAAGEEFRFVDVRMPGEREQNPAPDAEPLDFEASAAYLELPRDTRIVFACEHGVRSLDVAAYFAGHGFTRVVSLRDGLESWRREKDAPA
jgi:rhodanese-related sulfurtransferase